MEPISAIASAAAGIGASTASPLIQGGFGLIQQDKQHAHDRRMQERQWMLNRYDTIDERKYNTYMANSAYQRTVKDLRKAGLNPILMFGGASPFHYSGNSARSVSAPSTSAGGGISGFNLLDGLETISRIDANSALKAKYDAEAKLTEARTPYERAKGVLGDEAEGGFNTVKKITSELGKKAGSVVGNWIFNREKHSAAPIPDNAEALRTMQRLEKQFNGSGKKGFKQPIEIRKFAP